MSVWDLGKAGKVPLVDHFTRRLHRVEALVRVDSDTSGSPHLVTVPVRSFKE